MDVCNQCEGSGIISHPDSRMKCNQCEGSGVTNSVLSKEIFIGESSDDMFSTDRNDLLDCGEITRYVNEKMCVELKDTDILLHEIPLLNAMIDKSGNVWVMDHEPAYKLRAEINDLKQQIKELKS